MRTWPTSLAQCVIAAILAGCQTSSQVNSASEARLTAAGFVNQDTRNLIDSSSFGGHIRVDRIYSCESARCGSKALLVIINDNIDSTDHGMTIEELIRKKLLKDTTWRDIMGAFLKEFEQKDRLVNLRQFSNTTEAGVEFEIIGPDKEQNKSYLIGQFVFKGNAGKLNAAISNNRNIAKRSLPLLSGM